MARNPLTPDCSVDGCTRAAFSVGLCRKHRPLVPADFGIRTALDAMIASHRAAKDARGKAAEMANAALRREDSSPASGMGA